MQASIQLGMSSARSRPHYMDLAFWRVPLALAIAAAAIVIGAPDGPGPGPTVPRAASADGLAGWAIGDLPLRYESSSEPVDAAGSRAAVLRVRGIEDPVARAQAELASWSTR
jgi:hypothetical protein